MDVYTSSHERKHISYLIKGHITYLHFSSKTLKKKKRKRKEEGEEREN